MRNKKWRTVEHKKGQQRPQIEGKNKRKKKENFKTRILSCLACHKEGYIRRECAKIRYNLCNMKGHVRKQC